MVGRFMELGGLPAEPNSYGFVTSLLQVCQPQENLGQTWSSQERIVYRYMFANAVCENRWSPTR